ncbi:hypothetical protein H0H87_003330 [Tephrocybe sp. NHM501043]|nr:hypothetical protein H0H87_003330 [Tephrocybe sp. NHM501043]
MSRTQTRSKTQAMDDGRRDRRKFEVWRVNQEAKPQGSGNTVDGGAGQWLKNGRVTTLDDLPTSPSRPYFDHQDAPEKLRRPSTGRHRTLSTNARPLDYGYASAAEAPSRSRRASVDHTERRDAHDPALPYDSRHMFHDTIPDRRIRSEAERKLSQCMKEKKAVSEKLQITVEKLDVSERRNQELEEEVKSLMERLKLMKGQLHETESRRRRTARLFQDTASELHGTKYFLTKADAASDIDVVDLVDNLNAEIMQTSALMADALGDVAREKEPESTAASNERLFNRRALGDAMIHCLEVDGKIDPMAIQLALQFCIVETCYVIVESWRPGDWRGDDALNQIYASLKKTVIQPVFGRWRSLARSQTNYQESHAAVYSYLHRRIKDILSFAGWPLHVQQNHEFLSKFKDRIDFIVKLALRLHRTSSESMTSSELRTKVVYPKETFDYALMDEAFPDEMNMSMSEIQVSGVAGTTDLGLVRSVGGESRTFRKPKVVLISALHALLAA